MSTCYLIWLSSDTYIKHFEVTTIIIKAPFQPFITKTVQSIAIKTRKCQMIIKKPCLHFSLFISLSSIIFFFKNALCKENMKDAAKK